MQFLIALCLTFLLGCGSGMAQSKPALLVVVADESAKATADEITQQFQSQMAVRALYLSDPKSVTYLEELGLPTHSGSFVAWGEQAAGEEMTRVQWFKPFQTAAEGSALIRERAAQFAALQAPAPPPGAVPPPASVPAPVASAPAPAPARGRLDFDQTLSPGQTLESSRGAFRLSMQNDGNCVVYGADGRPIWGTATRSPGSRLEVTRVGQVRVVGAGGGVAWEIHDTQPNGQYFLEMQDDGNLCLYSSRAPGSPPVLIWASQREGQSNAIR